MKTNQMVAILNGWCSNDWDYSYSLAIGIITDTKMSSIQTVQNALVNPFIMGPLNSTITTLIIAMLLASNP